MNDRWYEDVNIQLAIAAFILIGLWGLSIIDMATLGFATAASCALINAAHVQQLHEQIDRLERHLDRQ